MDLPGLVKSYVIDDRNDKENDIYEELNGGKSCLLDVVECLGAYLTSAELSERSRSTQLLSSLLDKLTTSTLKQNEVSVLVTFYCDRIKDHHSIQPHVLSGMSALCQCQNISTTNIQQTLRQINKELHIQSLSQKDRKYYYSMIIHLLTNRLEDCRQMGEDFVYCYMQAMDSEKDPRHLLVAFQCVTIIAQNLPLGVFAEDLFEVVSCYFPIDFSPPPNDPHGIRKDDLESGLQAALSASPRFAEFCLPLLLEKATSSIPSAKTSAFNTMVACAPVYGGFALKEYLGSFWSAIQREVIYPYSTVVETAALKALTAITSTLSAQKGSSLLQGFIKDAFQDTRRHLNEPDQKLSLPNARLLETIAQASKPACVEVTRLLMPLLLGLYASHTQVNSRRVTLEIIVSCIKTVKEYSFPKDDSPLSEHHDSLYPLLVHILSDSSAPLRCLGVVGLVGLVALQDFLTQTELTNTATHFLQAVTHDTDSALRKEAVSALTYMSTRFPTLVKEHVLQQLVARLTADKMEVDGGGGDSVSVPVHLTDEYLLQVIASLSTDTDLLQYTVPILTQYLQDLNVREEVSGHAVNRARVCCSCLSSVVLSNIDNTRSREYFCEELLCKCFSLAVTSTPDPMLSKSNTLLQNLEVLRSLAGVVRNMVCHLDKEQCRRIVNTVVNSYLGKENSWNERCNNLCISKQNYGHQKLVVLLSAVISSLPKDVLVPESQDIESWLYSLCSEESEVQTDAAKCLAALFNKYAPPDIVLEETDLPVGHLFRVYKDKNKPLGDRLCVFKSLLWVTKAAVLASHKLQYRLTDMVIEALQDRDLSEFAAGGFYIILNEFEDTMSVEMHADVKIMYRQRFFHITMPKIIGGFLQATNDCKPHYLTALSYLLRFVPKEVLMAELPPVMPLLIQSLQLCDQPELWLSTLNTLYDLMHDAPQTFHTHLSDLIPSCLKLVTYPHNMKVRIAATQCVGLMSSMPSHLVLPHRPAVLKELAKILDNHKRLVRKEAALARGEWFLLGQPGGKK